MSEILSNTICDSHVTLEIAARTGTVKVTGICGGVILFRRSVTCVNTRKHPIPTPTSSFEALPYETNPDRG